MTNHDGQEAAMPIDPSTSTDELEAELVRRRTAAGKALTPEEVRALSPAGRNELWNQRLREGFGQNRRTIELAWPAEDES